MQKFHLRPRTASRLLLPCGSRRQRQVSLPTSTTVCCACRLYPRWWTRRKHARCLPDRYGFEQLNENHHQRDGRFVNSNTFFLLNRQPDCSFSFESSTRFTCVIANLLFSTYTYTFMGWSVCPRTSYDWATLGHARLFLGPIGWLAPHPISSADSLSLLHGKRSTK